MFFLSFLQHQFLCLAHYNLVVWNNLPAFHTCSKITCKMQFKLQFQKFSDTLCLTGDTSNTQTCCSSTPSSSVADIPMQTSELLKTIESYKTLSFNHRKYLDLQLFIYDFNTEISVLNDTNIR